MAKPSDQQVAEQIAALKKMQPRVRHYTMFGDNNWDVMDAQVEVLEKRMSGSEIDKQVWSKDDEADMTIRSAAMDARRWLDGEPLEDGEKDLVAGWKALEQA